MLIRAILPEWAAAEFPDRKRVVETECDEAKVQELNSQHYNIYFLPNPPSRHMEGVNVEGSHIDTFLRVFVDMDLKAGAWPSKEAFIEHVRAVGPEPELIADSGNGVHVYWQVQDLDAMTYLRFQRRLCRHFNTDEAVSKIYQLMRVPGTYNTKAKDSPKLCDVVFMGGPSYAAEEFDKLVPVITVKDERYCVQHFDKTYGVKEPLKVSEKIPTKFNTLIQNNKEAQDIWAGNTSDRSAGDYRLGHIMLASGFTREEAASVLVNAAKALGRAPHHRISYAEGIIDKIWTYEQAPDKEALTLSKSVQQILRASGNDLKGVRFPCYTWIDNTAHGFRLGQVIGLVAGSGVGKTAMALNMFEGFVQSNPNYDHFFISLEQPANEIAERWRTMCGGNESLHAKVHIISNYDDDGTFRDLSLATIKDYVIKFKKVNNIQVGCVVIDHIGVLSNDDRNGIDEGVKKLCKQMKSFAVQTNTLLVMQSQTAREKAGIGDLELNKDAAFGTSAFENYCDYLITLWQPLKRMYKNPACPTVTSFKFCKIRHKKKNADKIQEDIRYNCIFDPETERVREMTEVEEKQFKFFCTQAASERKQDRKTEVAPYVSRKFGEDTKDGKEVH